MSRIAPTPSVAAVERSMTPSLTPGQFFGGIDRQWSSDLVTVTIVRHDSARSVPEHSHAHAFIMLLLEGRYRERVDGARIECLPMSLVFHPEGLVHQDDIISNGARFLTVEVAPTMMSGDIRRDAGVCSVRDLTGGPGVWLMLGLLRDLATASHSPLAVEEPVAELLQMLTHPAARQRNHEPAWLSRVDRMLDARYRRAVPLLELAHEAGVHPVHLSRVFKRARGHSIRTAVHRRRVLDACRLLQDSRPSLAEIALITGFCDQSHLTSVVRRMTGFSPRRMRQLIGRRP
jgi:AraC family transcriptional regulator